MTAAGSPPPLIRLLLLAAVVALDGWNFRAVEELTWAVWAGLVVCHGGRVLLLLLYFRLWHGQMQATRRLRHPTDKVLMAVLLTALAPYRRFLSSVQHTLVLSISDTWSVVLLGRC